MLLAFPGTISKQWGGATESLPMGTGIPPPPMLGVGSRLSRPSDALAMRVVI